jgi:hypothetical protein
MEQTNDLGTFLKDSKKIAGEYIETRLEIYRLLVIRAVSRSAGLLLWVIISLILLALLMVFFGLVTGFWLSELTGSYTLGFGITAIAILLVIILLTLLRKPLFVNPIVRKMLENIHDEQGSQKHKNYEKE